MRPRPVSTNRPKSLTSNGVADGRSESNNRRQRLTVSVFGDSVLPALSVAEKRIVVVPSAVITTDALLPCTTPYVV
jgi:hypothetical protein